MSRPKSTFSEIRNIIWVTLYIFLSDFAAFWRELLHVTGDELTQQLITLPTICPVLCPVYEYLNADLNWIWTLCITIKLLSFLPFTCSHHVVPDGDTHCIAFGESHHWQRPLITHNDSDLHPPCPFCGHAGLLHQTPDPVEGQRVQGNLEGPCDVFCCVWSTQHFLPLCNDLWWGCQAQLREGLCLHEQVWKSDSSSLPARFLRDSSHE